MTLLSGSAPDQPGFSIDTHLRVQVGPASGPLVSQQRLFLQQTTRPLTVPEYRESVVEELSIMARYSSRKTAGCTTGGRVIASPYARKLAREAGVDVGDASGSGPDGRIVAADVQQLISSGGLRT